MCKISKVRQNINAYIGHILINKYVGSVIKKLFKFINYHGILINIKDAQVSPKIAAALLFGAYESAEIRFVKKYLNPDLPILELGSSLGIVGSIASRITNQGVLGIEANANLFPFSEQLIMSNKINNYKIINYALFNKSEVLKFRIESDNTIGHITQSNNDGFIDVQGLSYEDILNHNKINTEYILISDVEGAEIFLIYENVLTKLCKLIFIELHNFNFNDRLFTVEDMKIKLEEQGYSVKARHGNCFVFERI